MKLKYDPYNIFKGSRSTCGLYARQKWLGEHDLEQWKSDYNSVVKLLYNGQSTDGSWNHSTLETIQRLFGLHLTVRQADKRINSAIEWLLNNVFRFHDMDALPRAVNPRKAVLKGLPFVLSRPETLNIGATLFLSSIFGKENDPRVVSLYHRTVRNEKSIFWNDSASANNILRALVVHPGFRQDPIVSESVKSLRLLQSDRGDWGWRVPFYLTVNALAHLELADADRQLEKAFDLLAEIQNKDGSWSDDQPEWNTFLVVHALRNKKVL